MGTAYLWVKALHVIFVIAWFAGLFYLPRIFVNVAMVEDVKTRGRLLLMARKLLKFMTGLGVLAVVFGVWLLSSGTGLDAGWMQAKLVLVFVLIAYHGWCAMLYAQLASGSSRHTHVWFRWFNEMPVLLLAAIVVLVIVKPF
jgi:protoporphyrinogen IX oxidase